MSKENIQHRENIQSLKDKLSSLAIIKNPHLTQSYSSEINEKLFYDLKSLNYKMPVIFCAGSNKVLFDSFGPLVGSSLINRLTTKLKVYGTLNCPITARNLEYFYRLVKKANPNSKIIAVDACATNFNRLGTVNLFNTQLKAGTAFGAKLPPVGDCTIKGYTLIRNSTLNILDEDYMVKMAYQTAVTIDSAFN